MTDTSIPTETRAVESLRRAELYRWFAGLLASRLDPVLLTAYRSGPGRAVLDNLRSNPTLEVGAARVEAALDTDQDDAALSKALAADFAALFEEGGAPPTASAWSAAPTGEADDLEEAPETRRDPVGVMMAWLRRSGLRARASLPREADHVAVQLDLMAQLIEEGARGEPGGASGEEAWREQAVFLEDHLLSWLPAFRDACIRHDPEGFYAGVAMLLVAYVEQDRRYLRELS